MRPARDFVPGQLYAVTQRGNRGQWVYCDAEDFLRALDLMSTYAERYRVRVHGWCLMQNHGHWVFEAASETSISDLMRDIQSRYSRYLNQKYAKEPWKLLGPLGRKRKGRSYSRYLRAGPVNWTPRFDAQFLDGEGFKSFLRYAELNPVRAGLVKKAERWRWSSARAHFEGSDYGGLLCLDQWRGLFGDLSFAAAGAAWQEFVQAPGEEAAANVVRVRRMRTAGTVYNRVQWLAPSAAAGVGLALGAGSPPV